MIAEGLEVTVRSLLDDELWESAAIVGSLLTSVRTEDGGVSLALYADALVGKKEYKRAMTLYSDAQTRAKRFSGSSRTATLAQLASLRFREAKCADNLGDRDAAIAALEGISTEVRTATVEAFLGRLYHAAGRHANAVESYKAALRMNPLCLQVVEPLLDLGVTAEVLRSSSSSEVDDSRMEVDSQPSTSWHDVLVRAHAATSAHEYGRAVALWRQLDGIFPSNAHGALRLGSCLIETEELVLAQYAFDRVRRSDPHCGDLMDRCGFLIKRRGGAGAKAELNALAQQLLKTDSKRPEPWCVLALELLVEEEHERALAMVARAVELDPNHAGALLLQGEIYLALGNPELASKSFAEANSRKKDVASFRGLVVSFLASKRFREALGAAKRAVETLPNNALAIALVGKVLATSEDKSAMAKRAFAKALNIDAGCTEAALALVEILQQHPRDYAECIDVLKGSLHALNPEFAHAKLAEIYALDSQYSKALESYHTAISHAPNSEKALRGIERLEKLMRGEDPEETSTSGDNNNNNNNNNMLSETTTTSVELNTGAYI